MPEKPWNSGAWLIINQDKQQFVWCTLESLGYTFLWCLLMTPPPLIETFTPSKYTATQGSKTGILDIPSELLDAIFHKIDNAQDTLSFSLTSKLFTIMRRRYVHALFGDEMGLWAGDRIVFIDPHMPLNNPEEVYTNLETASVQEFLQKNEGRTVKVRCFVEKTAERLERRIWPDIEFSFRRKLHGKDAEMFDSWAMPSLCYPFPSSSKWVLCNHSKGEFWELKAPTPGPWVRRIPINGSRLFDATRLCKRWHKTITTSNEQPYYVMWGDCVEITTTDRMPAGEWKKIMLRRRTAVSRQGYMRLSREALVFHVD